MIIINDIETCKKLTDEHLPNLNDVKVLYMDNSMVYALLQEKVNAINKLLSSEYQNMELLKSIVENYFQVMVLVPIVENPKLDNDIISYIINNIERIELPTNPDWVCMNNKPKEFFEAMILDALYMNKNINDDLKKIIDKKCSSFMIEKTSNSEDLRIVNKYEDLFFDKNHINKRFIIYKGMAFEGLDDGTMGINNNIDGLFAVGINSDDIIVKTIPAGFLNDTAIHEYDNVRLHLLVPNSFSSRKFLYIKGCESILVDEYDILEVKKLITGDIRKAKHYHIEEYGKYYKVINRQHTFVFNHKNNRIIDIS